MEWLEAIGGGCIVGILLMFVVWQFIGRPRLDRLSSLLVAVFVLGCIALSVITVKY